MSGELIKKLLDWGVVQSLIASEIWDEKDSLTIKARLKNIDQLLAKEINKLEESQQKEEVKGFLQSYLNDYIKVVYVPNSKQEQDKIRSEFAEKYSGELSLDLSDVLINCTNIINTELYSLLDQEHKFMLEKILEEIKTSNTNLLKAIDKIFYIFNNITVKTNKKDVKKIEIIDQRSKFIKMWNNILFLHRHSEDTPIALKDLYTTPEFTYKNNQKPHSDALEQEIEYFIKNQARDRVLIILGQPGIGKSSFISYLSSRKTEYLYLSFVDLEIENGIMEGVIKALGCGAEDLINKVIVIDGYDENTDKSDVKTDHIQKLISGIWSYRYKNVKVILTSRVNYIDVDYNNVIELQPLTYEKIKDFIRKYNSINKTPYVCDFNANSYLDVLGIPLLLYMICSMNIDISKNVGINQLFEKIFTTEEGGLYEKCRLDGYGYNGEVYHTKVSDWKDKIHIIAQNIAFSIYIKDDKELCIGKDKYIEEVKKIDPELINIFAIANYYDIGLNLRFVHRSTYEYFVALYFYSKLKELTGKVDIDAKKLAVLCKVNIMSDEIIGYLKYMIDKDELSFTRDYFERFMQVFNKMIKYGMTYALEDRKIDILKTERIIFINILELFHLLKFEGNKKIDNIEAQIMNNSVYRELNLEGMDFSKIYCRNGNILKRANLGGGALRKANLSGDALRKANLSNADLIGADLIGADLSGAELSNADLSGANLSNGDLRRAYLVGADLSDANLSGAHLNNANLSGAAVRKAILSEADLRKANLKKANLRRCTLRGADLSEAYLRGADLIGVNLSDAILGDANLRKANLNNANLRRANLRGADLIGANLSNSNLRGADLRGANLSNANLSWAALRGADLRGANLSNANLSNAALGGANLCDANLSDVALIGAKLSNADLSNVALRRTNLSNANLSWTALRGAQLIGAKLIGADLIGADLTGANLSYANLKGAKLGNAILGVYTSKKGEIQTNFTQANLEGVDLKSLDLKSAILDHTIFDE